MSVLSHVSPPEIFFFGLHITTIRFLKAPVEGQQRSKNEMRVSTHTTKEIIEPKQKQQRGSVKNQKENTEKQQKMEAVHT
jgi:hypothetical protein